VLALRDQLAPPMTNLQDIDEACCFCLVKDKGLATELEYAMTNSFGFGGTNASLIFRRYQGEGKK
jgi:3-oxoacyl-[acyl-carrier-protein] synthase II